MTVKVGGKTYKGKYRGPDQFKGDMKKVRADAAKRKALKTGSKTVAKAVPKPKTTVAKNAISTAAKSVGSALAGSSAATPGAPTVPNPGAVGSNSSGNIQLQSNIDIEQQAMDATQYLQQENERATQLRSQAAIEEAMGQKQAQEGYQQNRGRTNAVMASRGMRGSAAQAASDEDRGNYQKMIADVAAKKAQAETESSNIGTSANNWYQNEQGKLTLARQAYTDEQSKENPTTGSSPVDSGLKATTPYTAPAAPKPVATTTAAKKVVPKVTVKKTFKGKYPGPERFKGDKKKIAIWKASKRKVVKK